MKKKSTVHLSAAVLAAFLVWPANAEDSAPAPAKAPDPTAAASAVPAVAPAAGAERPRIEPRLADTPEEKEHARRMAAIATLRDTKTQEADALEREAEARRAEILKENEEAGELAKKVLDLNAQFTAATNELEKIFLADEALQAKLAQAKAAREAAFAQQKNLNLEIVEAMRRRMGERRTDTPEERAKRGPGPAPRSAAERIRLPGPPPPDPAPDTEKADAKPSTDER